MTVARILVCRFFSLSHVDKMDVAKSLGLYREGDDEESFEDFFIRAIETNAWADVWDAVEKKHGDNKYLLNPFRGETNVAKDS